MEDFKKPIRINQSHKEGLFQVLLKEKEKLRKEEKGNWQRRFNSLPKVLRFGIPVSLATALVIVLFFVFSPSKPFPKCENFDCFLSEAKAAYENEKSQGNIFYQELEFKIKQGDHSMRDFDESKVDSEIRGKTWTRLSDESRLVEEYYDKEKSIPHRRLFLVEEILGGRVVRHYEAGSPPEIYSDLPEEESRNHIPPEKWRGISCFGKENKEYLETGKAQSDRALELFELLLGSNESANKFDKIKILDELKNNPAVEIRDLGMTFVEKFGKELRGFQIRLVEESLEEDIKNNTEELYFDPQSFELKRFFSRDKIEKDYVVATIDYLESRVIPEESKEGQDLFDPKKQGLSLFNENYEDNADLLSGEWSRFIKDHPSGCYQYLTPENGWRPLSEDEALEYLNFRYQNLEEARERFEEIYGS